MKQAKKKINLKSDVMNQATGQAWVYSDIVKDHFFNPRNLLLKNPQAGEYDAIGEVGSPACGDVMKIWIKMDKKNDKIIVKEMRTEGDVNLIKENFGKSMKIIQVKAPKQSRFERLKKRGRLGDPKTLDEFDAQEQREEELGYTKALEFTEHEIENNGTFDELYKRTDALLKSMGFS